MSAAAAAPPPRPLERLKVLSPTTAGIRVSPLALGGGNIGASWSSFWGQMTKEGAFALLDAYVEAGGNFIDTSNGYQNEESEAWIGEWMEQRGNRDRLVVATKFTANYRAHGGQAGANHAGNSRRSLHMSVRDSLRKLRTDYIDLLYVHWWDDTTSVEELMDSLHALVLQGKVLYVGASDTPAWVVSAANTYARLQGKTPFSAYQGLWNVLLRDFERDILPMARAFGMALVPWGVLGQGKFQTDAMLAERAARGETVRLYGGPQTDAEKRMSDALADVAAQHGIQSVTAIALAYVRRKAAICGLTNVFPIVGGRRPEQLHENLLGLDVCLTDDQLAFLERVQPFDIGFPASFLREDGAIRVAVGMVDLPPYHPTVIR